MFTQDKARVLQRVRCRLKLGADRREQMQLTEIRRLLDSGRCESALRIVAFVQLANSRRIVGATAVPASL